jgi:hypothetical protein
MSCGNREAGNTESSRASTEPVYCHVVRSSPSPPTLKHFSIVHRCQLHGSPNPEFFLFIPLSSHHTYTLHDGLDYYVTLTITAYFFSPSTSCIVCKFTSTSKLDQLPPRWRIICSLRVQDVHLLHVQGIGACRCFQDIQSNNEYLLILYHCRNETVTRNHRLEI